MYDVRGVSERYNLIMYDKDDDIIDIDAQFDSAKSPYDYDGEFSSPYDAIADLEKTVEEDVSKTEVKDGDATPEMQFAPKKKSILDSNGVFYGAIAVLALIIVGGLYLSYTGALDIEGMFASLSKSSDKQEQNVPPPAAQNPEDRAVSVDISTANGDEISRILDEGGRQQPNMPAGQDVMPGLPGMPNNGQIPQIDNDVLLTHKRAANIGRMDPFNPSGGNEMFDVMSPPMDVTPDPGAQALMSVKITGIMYSSDSPSAIINIAGSDQLVRPGDTIDGFHIDRITKDKVTVRNGKNIYTASVGELVDMSAVGVRDVPNMRKKFAGPYSGGGRIIEINSMY